MGVTTYIHPQSLNLEYLLLVLVSWDEELISELGTHAILVQLHLQLLLHQLVDHDGSIQTHREELVVIEGDAEQYDAMKVRLYFVHVLREGVLTNAQ